MGQCIIRERLMKLTSATKKLLSEFVNHILNESFVALSINGKTFDVELATSTQDHISGLMHRLQLGDDEGMLFVFPYASSLSFWMKDTHVPLSIAYMCKDGNILNIEDLDPYSTTSVQSRAPAKYALEMNRGWFRDYGIYPGDKVKGLPG